MNTEELKISTLTPYKGNPRRGDVDLIAKSLETTGQYRAIVVNKGTLTGRALEVLAGNHTLRAARKLGWKTILGHVIDVDAETAQRIMLADNRLNDIAGYDNPALLQILQTIPTDELIGTGYDDAAITDLLTEIDQFGPEHMPEERDEDDPLKDWETFSVKLPPALKGQLEDKVAVMPGATTSEKVAALLDRAIEEEPW